MNIPGGKGELFDSARRLYGLANAHDELVDRMSLLEREQQERLVTARRPYLKLPDRAQRVYDPMIESIDDELDRLRGEAEEAKLVELKGLADGLPDGERWVEAKRRFNSALTREVDLSD